MELRRYFGAAFALCVGFAAPLWPARAACPSGGIYTPAQAGSGKADYDAHCASCHNADLSGNSGPALAGPKFVSYLNFTKITPVQLLAFITSQMPADTPGSLTAPQYRDILAYLLSYNHYPAGTAPISPTGLSCLNFLPYPGDK
jgi:S-disulfanyl-L-cysteine oxidoreductase SoxD